MTSQNIRYFQPIPTTCEELKKMYRALAFQHHPDRGGNLEAMKAVNNEYDALFAKLKDIHTNAQGETYTASTPTSEAPEEFRDIIAALINLDGLVIEIIGKFVWLSGNTKPHKDIIKSLGFRWSNNKMSWYKSPEGYRRRTGTEYTLDAIRDMFGSQQYTGSQRTSGHAAALTA